MHCVCVVVTSQYHVHYLLFICSFYLFCTVLSFVEMTEFIFNKIPGASVFLSNRICQDPLKKFFGQQRQRGRASYNPNVSEFLKNTQALRVIDGVCREVQGNCREAKGKENHCSEDYINIQAAS